MPLTEKAFLEIEGRADTIPCMFNPAELTVSRTNSWRADSIGGQGVGQVRYLGAQSGEMRLTLHFDTTDTGQSVGQHTGKVLKLMDVDSSLPGTDAQSNNARPPYVVFHWGNLHSFKAVVTDLTLRFTYFSSTGVPLRAEVDLYGDDALRRLLVKPGMTGLWQVSGRSDLSWDDTVRLDLYYVDNWSMLQDLSILMRTFGAVFGPRGAY